MIKHINKVFKGSLKRKLVIAISFSIIIPFLLTAIYYYRFSEKIIKNKIIESNTNSLHQINYNLENIINEISAVSNMISQDVKMIDILSGNYFDEKEEIKNRITVNEFCRNAKRNIFTISAEIIIMSANKKIYSTCVIDNRKKENLYETNWYKEIVNKNGFFYWFSSLRNEIGILENNYKKTMNMGRLIKNFKGENCGIILVAIDWQQLYDSIEKLVFMTEQSFFIIEPDGRIILHSDNYYLNNESYVIDKVSDHGKGVFDIKENGTPILISCENVRSSNWRLVMLTPYKYLFGEIEAFRKQIFLITVLMFIASVVIIFAIIHKSFSPVKSLEKIMKKVQEGNFDVRFNMDLDDEIGSLGKSFNSMIDKIKNLIRENYEKQEKIFIKERDKEKLKLLVMQSQINPHFLFNTLNNIKWVAMANNANMVADYITAVGRLLELSIKIADDEIYVEQEISYLKEFIKISKLRYQNKFDVIYDIDKGILNSKILKLTLQPIVENSIIHGISRVDYHGKIIIRGYRENNDLVFVIEDNGAGMDIDYAKSLLNADDKSNKGKFNQLGIYNTNKRIKINYGEKYGLSIESIKNSYTRTTIVLPVK